MNIPLPIFRYFDAVLADLGPVRLIEFEIPGGTTTPEAFAQAVASAPPETFSPPGRGIIFSGRGPVWGYAMMLHASHPTPWTATADPRLGAVVVQSHVLLLHVGQVIPQPVVDAIVHSQNTNASS
jgi:CRISPR-associated protein Csx3